MKTPKWADDKLSDELQLLLEQGEGQLLEFKRDFPEQAHELGIDIAAFASSEGGRILVGVDDDGSLVGLEAKDGSARDRLMLRAQNISLNSRIQPKVNVRVVLAFESGMTVLCIEISKQTEAPVYYDNRPYIRVGRQSRPAEPSEVRELVWKSPSSRFHREMEEIKLAQHRTIMESGRVLVEEMAQSRARRNQRMERLLG